MYSSKNSQFTPIYLAKKKINSCGFCLCLLILLFSGCSKNNSVASSDDNPIIPITKIATPTALPKYEPSPTVKPSASVMNDEELTIQSAQEIIEDRIDTQKYTVNLLTEELKIDSQNYIAFIANKDSTPQEPIILVNKSTGIVSCLSSEGKSIAFSNFPATMNQQDNDNLYNWSGTFYRKDNHDRLLGTMQIVQNDSSSFEFFIYSSDSVTSLSLAGIGHIEGNYAIFTDEAEQEIIFSIIDDTINVYDSEENFSSSGLSIGGDYTFQSYDIENDYKIGIDKAIELLSRLNMYQTKLPAELSEYKLISQDSLIIVKDRICYVIGAYASFEDRQVLMATFYVSIDGSVVFAYDNISNEPYAIIPLFQY